jgi:hypothetical protein
MRISSPLSLEAPSRKNITNRARNLTIIVKNRHFCAILSLGLFRRPIFAPSAEINHLAGKKFPKLAYALLSCTR